jgi:hypothetical protein
LNKNKLLQLPVTIPEPSFLEIHQRETLAQREDLDEVVYHVLLSSAVEEEGKNQTHDKHDPLVCWGEVVFRLEHRM